MILGALVLITVYNNCSARNKFATQKFELSSIQQESASNPTTNSNDIADLSLAKTLYKITYGGMMPPDMSNIVVARRLDDAGRIINVYGDKHEVVIAQLSKAITEKLINRIAHVDGVERFSLKGDTNNIMCDVFYQHDIYINGQAITVERQNNCGPHEVLFDNCTDPMAANASYCTSPAVVYEYNDPNRPESLKDISMAIGKAMEGLGWTDYLH